MKSPRTAALVLLLLLGLSSAGAQDLFGSQNVEAPKSYITPEVFGYGTTFRIGGIDIRYWRLRLGTSLLEAGYTSWSIQPLPVRLGFTIWQRPHCYGGNFYGMLPEVYVQATASSWLWRIDPPPYDSIIGHAELRVGADFFGVGLDAGVGVGALYATGLGPPYVYRWQVNPVIDARLKIGVTNFGFWE